MEVEKWLLWHTNHTIFGGKMTKKLQDVVRDLRRVCKEWRRRVITPGGRVVNQRTDKSLFEN